MRPGGCVETERSVKSHAGRNRCNLANPAVADFHIPAFDRRPRYTVRDLLLMGIA
jgi:hypothetical protein